MPLKIDPAEWMSDRSVGIGASDVATILFENPNKGPYALYLEKTKAKDKQKPNKYTGHGTKTEAEARQAFTDKEGLLMPPATLQCTLPGYEFMRVSLDGLEPRKKRVGLEIKCPREPGAHRQAKEGQPPMEYWVQMQAQMAFAELDCVYYWSYYRPSKKEPADTVLLRIRPDVDYIETVLKPGVKQFWSWVQNRNYPLPEGEEEITDEPEFEKLAAQMILADAARESATREYDRVSALLRKRTWRNKLTTGYGISVEWDHSDETEINAYKRSPFVKMTVRRVI